MGYSGWIIVAKGDDTLAKEPAVAAHGSAVLAEYVRGDWRELWLNDRWGVRPSPAVAELVATTGAPAMAIYVMDEDCAVAYGATPSGRRWEGVFSEEAATAYEAMPPDYHRSRAVADALTWAEEAGLTCCPPEPVETALRDGWYSDLLERFGLPEGVEVHRAQ
ncbi:hypothetical protein [Streptomyces buecherae]|uniref:Uncharacterized protein n=1 Tax=Streptomyces buecherae TaxID=2763006 RepID=A0A7H8N9G3_9ACTN|nr:hypothetical protein [Streptomyces buecherae]QKW51114.1 hypothetical protein HUT08_18005 [Streptomyces buecherae]